MYIYLRVLARTQYERWILTWESWIEQCEPCTRGMICSKERMRNSIGITSTVLEHRRPEVSASARSALARQPRRNRYPLVQSTLTPLVINRWSGSWDGDVWRSLIYSHDTIFPFWIWKKRIFINFPKRHIFFFHICMVPFFQFPHLDFGFLAL